MNLQICVQWRVDGDTLERAGSTISHGMTPMKPNRLGATLIEVTISLLIMAIGIISLASLFPLSVLRSVRGNQLTMGTNHRYNAEAMIDIYPEIVHDPDSDNDYSEHLGTAYVFDPLGATMEPLPSTPGTLGSLTRYAAGLSAVQSAAPSTPSADFVCTSGDTFTQRFDEIATAQTTHQVTLPTLTAGAVPNLTDTRLVLFNANDTMSQVRPLFGIVGNNAIWNEDTDSDGAVDAGEDVNGNGVLDVSGPLPATFGTVGRVRIETQERRFTWMLTVRKDPAGVADVTVVVFFRRRFGDSVSSATEHADEDPWTNTNAFIAGSTQVTLPIAAFEYVRRGSHILDSVNAYWYRIENVSVDSSNTTITLDTPARAAGDEAILMHGIVDVYPLGQVFP